MSEKLETGSLEDSRRASQDDAAFLFELGYKQEFKRKFTIVETFGISFAIIGLVPSMAFVKFTYKIDASS